MAIHDPHTTTTITRRQWLRGSLAGGLGLTFASSLGLAAADETAAPPAVAKHLIVLWLNGGPSHVDTFDPKTGRDAGPFKHIRTRAPEIALCEHLPRLAEQADKLAIVRSMTSKEGNHDRARYYGHTGYAPNPTVKHPSLGAWVSSERDAGALPSFVSIGGPSAGGGLLGAAHDPFVMQRSGGLPDDVVHGFGVDDARFERRTAALAYAEAQFAARTAHPALHNHRTAYSRAQHMMKSDELRAFAIDEEPQATLDAYGDSDFGRGCLAARRLVEAGVAVVEVTLGGWDTHKDNFTRIQQLLGELDPAMAALVADLTQRNKLHETLLVCMGEFGRSPEINGDEGRDHHPQAWSAVLAGGGIRGGIAHGATDERGDRVAEKPVRVPDLFATIALQLGIDATKTAYSSGGRPIALSDGGSAVRALLA